MPPLDAAQRRTLTWAGLAVVLSAFGGSVLIVGLPAVASDFHARVQELSNVGSLLAIGALGAFPLATLADHFGRRRVIALGVAGFSIADLASAFVPSLTALAILRLVAVCFEALVGSVATALIVEEAPAAHRGQAISVLAILSGIGLFVAIVVYPLIAPHWRWLFMAAGVGVIGAPLIWRRLPEGRAWEHAHVSSSTVRLLLTRPWLRRVLILAGTTILTSLALEPAGLLYTLFASSTLHLSPSVISLVIFFSGVVALASYLAGGYLSDRFGRRIPGAVLTAGYTAFAGLGFVTGAVGFVIANLVWSGVASAATPVMGAWSGELYPTRARATAEATSAVAGAVGGIAGLQAVGLLTRDMGLGRAIAAMSVVALGGAVLLLLLPETRGRPLPE
ncbi:MAG TPA: MFS transporter [Candidatus Dormibacteraeota bacterium]|nr:MFS transporter [Candidatus Dormibacteraeota bacterium]